jgi:hypothetical protein
VEEKELRKNVNSTFHGRKINEKSGFARILKAKLRRCMVAGAVSRHVAGM